MKIDSSPIYFVSDTHFHFKSHAGERERRHAFIHFLSSLPDNATLFLLGDIFDFYFEYGTVIHNHYFDIFCALRTLKERGIGLHFIGGNHDSWVGPFMRDELGITVHKERVLIEAQGRVIAAVHGDLILPGDYGYKLLKSIIRNRVVIAVARCVHPDLLSALAVLISKGSKKITTRSYEPLAYRVADYAFERYFARGNDALIMGHIHFPLHRKQDGKEFIILGDWIDHFSYAILQNGVIETGKVTGGTRD